VRSLAAALGSRQAVQVSEAWVVEGLIYYLPEADAHRLLDELAALCPPGSTLLVDVAHPMMRDLPALQDWRDALVAMGEPFRFFTDDGRSLLAAHDWDAEAFSIADVGNEIGLPTDPVGAAAVRRLLSGRRV
jgi:O-methyltransferase involved in polyketide biosynthesis